MLTSSSFSVPTCKHKPLEWPPAMLPSALRNVRGTQIGILHLQCACIGIFEPELRMDTLHKPRTEAIQERTVRIHPEVYLDPFRRSEASWSQHRRLPP